MPILGRFQMLVCYFLLAVRLGFLSVINWYTGNPLAILRQTYQTSDLGSEMRGITLFGAQTISTQYQGMSSSPKQQKNNINLYKLKMPIANSNKKFSSRQNIETISNKFSIIYAQKSSRINISHQIEEEIYTNDSFLL